MNQRLAALKRIELYCTTHLVTAIPKIKLTRKQYREWDEKSYNQQMQYLEEHPDSIFQKVGVTKRRTRGKSKKNLEQQQEQNKGEEDEQQQPGDSESNNEGEAPAGSGGGSDAPENSDDENKTDDNSDSKPADTPEDSDNKPAPEAGEESKPEGEGEKSADDGEGSSNEKSADSDGATDSDSSGPVTSTPHREPDDGTKAKAEDNIKQLQADGATDPNSEQREGIAATVENSGKKVIEELDEEDVNAVEEGYEEEKEEIKKGRFSPRAKKIMAIMGMVALAGVAGIALFHVNPIIALYMGQMIGDNFGRIADAFKGDDDDRAHASIEEGGSSEVGSGVSMMLKDVAEYMRAGELPDDFVEAAKLSVGIDHEQE